MPIVEIADHMVKSKEPLDSSKAKTLVGDSPSLIGHAFYSSSMERCFNISHNLNPRYQKICNGDTQINTNLFGDNIMSRIKELVDPTKIPLGMGCRRFVNRGKFGLNFKGPAVGFDQQQGNISSFPRGRGYQRYHRGWGRRHSRKQNF